MWRLSCEGNALYIVDNQKKEDTSKKAGHRFTAPKMVTFWRTKVTEAGNTNTVHVLERWLNLACIEEDFSCDNQIQLA